MEGRYELRGGEVDVGSGAQMCACLDFLYLTALSISDARTSSGVDHFAANLVRASLISTSEGRHDPTGHVFRLGLVRHAEDGAIDRSRSTAAL